MSLPFVGKVKNECYGYVRVLLHEHYNSILCPAQEGPHSFSFIFYIVFATSYISFSFRRLFCSIYLLLFLGCFSIISFNTCDLLSRVPITFFTFYFSVFFPASSLFVYFTSKGGLWQLLMLLKPFVFFKVLFPSIFFLFFTHWRHIPNFKRLKVNSYSHLTLVLAQTSLNFIDLFQFYLESSISKIIFPFCIPLAFPLFLWGINRF